MITFDTQLLSILAKNYQLNTKRVNSNAYSSIDELTQAQAYQGIADQSVQGIKTNEIDYKEFVQSLNLNKSENRFSVLLNMSHTELVSMLYKMDKKDLVMGLKFFTKEKLIKFLNELPKKELLSVLFNIFPKDELVKLMPTNALSGLLDSEKVDKSQILKVLHELPPHILPQIYEAATGTTSGNKTKAEIIESISTLDKVAMSDGISAIANRHLVEFTQILTHNNNNLFIEFRTDQLMKPVHMLTKNEMIPGMIALEPKRLINMLDELPNEMLAQIVTLMDPGKLTEILLESHTDLLAELAAKM